MYIPKHFRIEDESLIENFIKENGFATLVTNGDGYPNATHIPLQLHINSQGEKVLCGHISKANLQWKDFETSPNVTAIFLSPVHHYISSSWYGHANAPTWNYLSVHVSGRIRILSGEALWDVVRRLTDTYEAGVQHPVSLDSLPPEVQKQMNGIVGFEIHIEKTECAFKLSQNRNEEDFENVVQELIKTGNASAILMAEIMKKYRQKD